MDFDKHIQRVISVLFMFQNRQRWRNRRSQRLDKMELLTLQSSLQSEIQAKSQIAEELSKIKSACVGYEKLVIQNLFLIANYFSWPYTSKCNEFYCTVLLLSLVVKFLMATTKDPSSNSDTRLGNLFLQMYI